MSRLSDYIVYTAEHGADGNEPFFIRNFCIFDKGHYSKVLLPQLQQFKFKHFGHDSAALTIENSRGPQQQKQFIDDITDILDNCNFILITCAVDQQMRADENTKRKIDDEALGFALTHIHRFLQEREQSDRLTYVIGRKNQHEADQIAQQTFRQLFQQDDKSLPLELLLSDSQHCPPGLEFAALLGEPITRHLLRPADNNPLFDALKPKFYCKGGRKKVGEGYEGWGLKIYSANG